MKKFIFLLFIFFMFCVNISAEKFEVEFSKCVDGDTFKALVGDEIKTVRMLAVDTPETVKVGTEVQPYGKEASEYTCNKISNANKIELEYDSKSNKTDNYGRILAWVYVDDSLIQEELVSLGYAKVAYIYGKYKYVDNLYLLEEEAALNKVGLWSNEEYVSKEETKDDSEVKTDVESIVDELIDTMEKSIKKYIKKIIKKIIKSIEELIESLLE